MTITNKTETRWAGFAIDPNGNLINTGAAVDRAATEKHLRRVAASWGVEVWLVEAEVNIETDRPVGEEIEHSLEDIEYWHQGEQK